MTAIGKINFQQIKTKLQLPKPFDIVVIFLLAVLITIPLFIIVHQNIIDFNLPLLLDRISLFLIILLLIIYVLKSLRTIIIICIGLYLLVLVFNAVFGYYSFSDVAQDYQSMMFTMANDPNPQDIIISKLLPFPNKSKILKAIDFENPKVRNFALMATTKHFKKNIKKFRKYRTLIQCFAVFTEIKNNWNYVNDPKGEEYIAKASESVLYFSGDCDDHAILMSACVRAIGGTPRIISTSDHFYPEILIGNKADFESINFIIKNFLFKKESYKKQLHYHIDERGKIWLNLDYTAKYPGGPFMSEEILGSLTLN
jgi:hypothetical protein